jgi:hypothetical protein
MDVIMLLDLRQAKISTNFVIYFVAGAASQTGRLSAISHIYFLSN